MDSYVELHSGSKSTTASIDHGEGLAERRQRESFIQQNDKQRKRHSVVLGDLISTVMTLDKDDPGWIHRDKLAQIENRELQAAGIVLPRSRAYSRTGRSSRSRETSANGMERQDRGQIVQKRQRIEVPPQQEELDQESSIDAEEKAAWDLRTQEEIEADERRGWIDYSTLSKNASKIPINMMSPAPVPINYLERDAPIPRQKSAVWGNDSVTIEYPRPQPKKESAPTSEPVKQESAKEQQPMSSGSKRPNAKRTQSSPDKQKLPTHGSGPGPNGQTDRKPSGPLKKTPPISHSSSTRPRTRGASGSISRPTTRSGEVKRPEGDPPWLATMFKPDPRLPPDQQLLPTVAKRLQQEQWEREGKGGTAYDTMFRPLNDEELRRQELPPSPTKETAPETPAKEEGQGEWPLRSTQDKNERPGTAGGYSTMPRISTVPLIQSPPVNQAQQPPRREVEVMQVEEETKNGGCGCCIVM